ncbi:MAG: CRISPR-associated endonuclease Cas6 [Bacteroidia bacterium]
MTLQTFHLGFDLPLRPGQLSQFAGAVATAVGWEEDLFHNHRGEEPDAAFHHRYPLIQYRVWKGKGELWAVGEGCEAIKRWLHQVPESLQIGKELMPLRISKLREESHELAMLSEPHFYRLMDYMPFNQDNYKLWQEAPHLTARVELLERVLTGHALGFASAMAYQLPERLELHLMSIRETRQLRFRQHSRLGFNLIFRANLALPDHMALGHHVSRGFGVVSIAGG